MEKLRRYGDPPFSTAAVHGGPGAPGSVAPVARELSARWGVLEPLARVVQDFRFTLLEKSGHFPWLERYAQERFYEVLMNEI